MILVFYLEKTKRLHWFLNVEEHLKCFSACSFMRVSHSGLLSKVKPLQLSSTWGKLSCKTVGSNQLQVFCLFFTSSLLSWFLFVDENVFYFEMMFGQMGQQSGSHLFCLCFHTLEHWTVQKAMSGLRGSWIFLTTSLLSRKYPNKCGKCGVWRGGTPAAERFHSFLH